MKIPQWDPVPPTEANENCLFKQELEDDPLVLFHVSPAHNLCPIASHGFRSAAEIGTGVLTSVSYSKSSKSWNTITGYPAKQDFVIFAVRFDTLDQPGIKVNPSDIHVYRQEIQPTILGYCEIPIAYPQSKG